MNTPPELLPLLDIARQALAPLQAERAARLGVVADPLPPEIEGELPDLRALLDESQQRLLEGAPEAAAAALHAMIDVLRRVVAVEPKAMPVLAGALNQLAGKHMAAGQLDAALWASVESAELHLAWARRSPEPQLVLLTQSLDTLATQVELQGRVVEGLQLRIAVWQLQTRLAENDPEMLPSLGLTVAHLAQQLGDLGQDELAVQLAEEGVDIQRRLESGFPLTQALTLLSERLAAIEDHEEALATIDEAMALAGEPGNEVEVMVRARMLRQRANCQRALDAWDEAWAAIDEAVRLYRRLALAHPAHRSNLAEALTVAALLHRDGDAHEEAVVLLAEAVGYLREDPRPFFLVDRLTLLAESLENLDRHDEALAADAEAVGLARAMCAQDPDRWGALLTACLEGQARRLSDATRHEDAAVAWHEVAALRAAVDGDEIDRALAVAEAQGQEMEAWLAANRLDRVGEALAAVIHTQRTMSPNRPRVQGQLARNLVELAGFYEDMGNNVSGALAALGEAAVLCGGLLATHPEVAALLAEVEEARARLTSGRPDVEC